MIMSKKVSVLGSTGSIGTQALEVCEKHGMEITALAAHSSIDLLEEQTRKYAPGYVCIFSEEKYGELKQRLADTPVKVLCGMEGLCTIAALEESDIVLNSVVGMVGLLPTLTAINAGKDLALANKETLVAGGELVMKAAAEKGVKIYPVDSEHSAVFQCLQGNKRSQLSKMILTASGGPFFRLQLRPAEKCNEGRCAPPPQLGHGQQDNHRLRYADEQGTGIHRSKVAV